MSCQLINASVNLVRDTSAIAQNIVDKDNHPDHSSSFLFLVVAEYTNHLKASLKDIFDL